jgi:hypothetical protein
MFGDKRRDDGTVTTHRRRRVMRPANVIAAVVGILAITLGVWALIETGLNTDHIYTPTKEVLGLPHTPTLALGEIGFGILLLFAAATGAFGTFLIGALGMASLAFGVIVLSDSWSDRVHTWTAANHDTGWMFILIGAVFVLAATLPLFASTRRVQTQEATATEPEPLPAEPEPLPAERGPAAISDPTTREDSRPEPAGTASLTSTETDTFQPYDTNTHKTG